jgi:hypothetical protein
MEIVSTRRARTKANNRLVFVKNPSRLSKYKFFTKQIFNFLTFLLLFVDRNDVILET